MNLLWRWKYNGGNEKEKVAAVFSQLPAFGFRAEKKLGKLQQKLYGKNLLFRLYFHAAVVFFSNNADGLQPLAETAMPGGKKGAVPAFDGIGIRVADFHCQHAGSGLHKF